MREPTEPGAILTDAEIESAHLRGRLTEAHLDLRQAERTERRGLVDLMLAKGSMQGPFRRPRRRSLLRDFIRFLLAPRCEL